MKIAVVGMGIVGSLTAYQLSKQGDKISIFAKEGYNKSTSYSSAGMLAPTSELWDSGLTIYQLGLRSIKVWQEILSQMDTPIFFDCRGSIITSHDNDTAELSIMIKRIISKMPCKNSIKQLSQDELSSLEPDLCTKHGYHMFNEAQIDAENLMDEIHKFLKKNAAEYHVNTDITDILPHTIITQNQQFKSFDFIFDCRGYGAKHAIPNLIPIRGELITVETQEVHITRPIRLLHPRYQIYIVPKPGSQYIVGTSSIETEDSSPISVRSCLQFLSVLYSINPAFAEARIINSRVGIRPTLPNNMPIIIHQKGLITVNGMYRHGFLISPAIVEEAIKSMHNQNTDHPDITRYK